VLVVWAAKPSHHDDVGAAAHAHTVNNSMLSVIGMAKTGIDRVRDHRHRRRAGVRQVTVRVEAAEVKGLIVKNYLTTEKPTEADVQAAVEAFITDELWTD
jgi:hypothetical protein